MAFPRAEKRIPTRIGRITLELSDIPVGGLVLSPARKFAYHLELLNDAGERVDTQTGDLEPRLTPAQRTGLNNLLDALRNKAAEALPEGSRT